MQVTGEELVARLDEVGYDAQVLAVATVNVPVRRAITSETAGVYLVGIRGMVCGSCQTSNTVALRKVPGVADVDVFLAQGLARVKAAPGRILDMAALVEAVRRRLRIVCAR